MNKRDYSNNIIITNKEKSALDYLPEYKQRILAKNDEENMNQFSRIYNYNKALGVVNEEDLSEILGIIPDPFLTEKTINDADVISIICNNFIENTEIPIALPVFSFFSLFSAYCVKRGLTYLLPMGVDKKSLEIWTIVLADSGSAKTFSLDQIKKIIPTDSDGQKVVKENFQKPNGPAKFLEDLSKLPETIDGKHQAGLWVEDEFAQLVKSIETPNSQNSEFREYFLKMRDNQSLTRRTKAQEIETKPIILTFLGLNTKESFVKNISTESIFDGFLRRFSMVFAEKDDRNFTDFAMYNIAKIRSPLLIEKIEQLFHSIPSEINYIFDEECHKIYVKYFKIFWERKYRKILTNRENFYRTYMMESWKYAIFHHLIMGKSGNVITADSMAYGLKVSLVFCESLKKFLDFKISLDNKKSSNLDDHLNKYIDYLKENGAATIRDFYRKFGLKKTDAIEILISLLNLNIDHPIMLETKNEKEKIDRINNNKK